MYYILPKATHKHLEYAITYLQSFENKGTYVFLIILTEIVLESFVLDFKTND